MCGQRYLSIQVKNRPKAIHCPRRGFALGLRTQAQIEIVGHAGRSWTLGFEAFGDLEGVSTNLTLVVLPDKPALACLLASGVFLSYPAWLRIRGRE